MTIDIVKVCLDPSPQIQLPQFYTIDISCLPPVGIENIDIDAILQELSSLHQEVHTCMSSQLWAEFDEVKNNHIDTNAFLQELSSLHQEVSQLWAERDRVKDNPEKASIKYASTVTSAAIPKPIDHSRMLCDLSLPNFDTVILNSKYCFKMQCHMTNNALVSRLLLLALH